MTNRRPNILSNTWRFDTSANWKMLGEEFEMWPADPLPDTTLITVGMHITNLGYLEDGPPRFTELPDGGTEESNRMLVGLDIAAVIPKTDDQDLPDLIDSEAKRANKKKEKAERRRQRKINLVQATAASGTLSSPDASACRPPSSPVASAGSARGASGGGAPSSPVAGGGPLSAVSGHFSSLVASGGPSSAISGRPSSPFAGGGLSSAVSGRPSSLVAGAGPSSTVSVRPSSPVPPAGSQALFLTSIPSCARCSSLPFSPLFHSSFPSSPTPLARNPAPLSGKRLFDQAFITQMLIASTQQQEELDLSFGQCSYSAFVKMNRSWQSELYDPKPVCLLEAIPLLSLLFWDDSFVPCTRHIALLAKKLGLTT